MMRIGELAQATGENVRTLRYWTDEGLLDAERSESGYRTFHPGAVDRVAFLRQAQALGLTLAEIRDVLELRREGERPCTHVRQRLKEHLMSVRERIDRLRVLEQNLEARLDWARAEPEPECEEGCVYLLATADNPGSA